MMAPRTRLLWLVALLVVPAATAATMLPIWGLVGWAIVAASTISVTLDAAMALGRLDGIKVELPAVSWHTQDRDSALEVTLTHEDARGLDHHLRVGLAWPEEFETTATDMPVVLPASSPRAKFSWNFIPRRRGKFQLDACYLETQSALGLWAVRRAVPATAELRVYPNLLTERNDLAALFLNRGMLGIHAQRQVGKGRDFEKLREYIPGDNYEDIHWKATAKRGHPVTKIFQVERTQEVYVVVDASRLSGRVVDMGAASGSRVTILERYVTAALILGLAAERQGDLFGLVTFGDHVENFVRARNGKAHYRACRDALYTLQPRQVTPDFEEVATFIRTRLRRRALLVFLTALDDPMLAETFLRSMDVVSRQHLVLVNVLRPAWARPVFAGADVESVDDVYQRLGGHMFWHDLRELDKQLQHRGIQFAQLDNEKLCAQLVTEYFNVKQRQLL